MKTKTIISTKRFGEHSVMQIPISLERDIIAVKATKLDGNLDFALQRRAGGSTLYITIASLTMPCSLNDKTISSTIENVSINLLKAFNELFEIDILDSITLPFYASEWFDGSGLSKEFKNYLIMSKLPAAANIGETKELCGVKYFYDYDGWHPVNTNSII